MQWESIVNEMQAELSLCRHIQPFLGAAAMLEGAELITRISWAQGTASLQLVPSWQSACISVLRCSPLEDIISTASIVPPPADPASLLDAIMIHAISSIRAEPLPQLARVGQWAAYAIMAAWLWRTPKHRIRALNEEQNQHGTTVTLDAGLLHPTAGSSAEPQPIHGAN